jgi:UDP-glucose 4-epimerase
VLHRAVTHDLPGVFNAAGDGVLLLSQAVRRAGRVALPMPASAVPAVARLARTAVSPGLARLLSFGRVVDTSRLRTAFGFTPRWSTSAALDDHVHARPPR